MLKDVTIGQYYAADSLIHRMDPRVKLRFTIVYLFLALIDRNLPLFGALTMVFLLAVILSKVPFSYILKGTRSIWIVILIGSAVNLFTTPGEGLVNILGLTVTEEGIEKFGFIFWRMVLLILMSSLVMYTTTPSELTDGLEKCFHLSGNIAMGITIALRFIPVLFEELDRIMKAQEARGADFKSGGVLRRVRRMRTILIPLFQNSIYRAGNLADAMDARCYTGGKGRTKLRPLTYEMRDVICYLFLAVLTFSGIWLAISF